MNGRIKICVWTLVCIFLHCVMVISIIEADSPDALPVAVNRGTADDLLPADPIEQQALFGLSAQEHEKRTMVSARSHDDGSIFGQDIGLLAPAPFPAVDIAGYPGETTEYPEGSHLRGIGLAQNLFFGTGDSSQSASDAESENGLAEPDIADPLEPLNRVFFTVNDKLYFWLMKPAANAYSFFVPEWGRERVRNVFRNIIKAPMRMVNSLLQLKTQNFGSEFAGFVLNSTVGVGGLFDIAARHPELKTNEEDFGQTLGSYGVGEGFYLVLPLVGPLSLRDSVGWVGDSLLDPVWYVSSFWDAFAIQFLKRMNDTSFMIGDYEDIKEAALDPYISIRDIYKQHRRNKVRE